jgi:hypothetical protein
MKTKQLIGSLVAACAVMFLYSCAGGGSNPSKMLVNKWQIESFKSTDFDKEMANLKQMSDTTKDTMMKAEISNKIKMEQSVMEALKNSVVEYKADSTFEMKVSFMGQAQTNKGKWALTADNKQIIQTDDRNKKDTMVIVEISSEKFIINSPDKSVTVTYKAVKS